MWTDIKLAPSDVTLMVKSGGSVFHAVRSWWLGWRRVPDGREIPEPESFWITDLSGGVESRHAGEVSRDVSRGQEHEPISRECSTSCVHSGSSAPPAQMM
jgi:hypothetical protein